MGKWKITAVHRNKEEDVIREFEKTNEKLYTTG